MKDQAHKLSRRDLLALGFSTAGSLLASRLLGPAFAFADEAKPQGKSAKAKSVIVLWLNGGASHLDTFDPKPGTSVGGPFKAIKSAAPGVELSEHLPGLASVSDRICFLRGMTSKEGNHQRAQEMGRTGHPPNPTVHAPSLGSWLAKYQARPNLDLPGFISLGGASYGAGFLGHEYDPLVISGPGDAPDDLLPYEDVGQDRDKARRDALAALDSDFLSRVGSPEIKSKDAILARATRMMNSKDTHAFVIDEEPDSVRKAYGDSAVGKGCLIARRLVEKGVPFVEVTMEGWDTHQNNFGKTKTLLGALDPAVTTLIKELEHRSLLSETVILCMGDFGRTPTINANDGRDHYPQAWSAFVAGGGVRGGRALGETDGEGRKVIKDPTQVNDLLATISSRMGLDPATVEHSERGRPIAVTDGGAVIDGLFT